MADLQTHLWELGIGIITVLGTANAYFIARLINRIDKNASAVEESTRQVAILTEKVGNLSDMQHRLVVVEKQIAVHEYILQQHQQRRMSDPSS